uniref:Uncharacterized protein n=1 Tax=Romanomermis culicivorax TaxID=13658 RepID=A0A915IS17_ROMCU
MRDLDPVGSVPQDPDLLNEICLDPDPLNQILQDDPLSSKKSVRPIPTKHNVLITLDSNLNE